MEFTLAEASFKGLLFIGDSTCNLPGKVFNSKYNHIKSSMTPRDTRRNDYQPCEDSILKKSNSKQMKSSMTLRDTRRNDYQPCEDSPESSSGQAI
jgi:hypothetical protein